MSSRPGIDPRDAELVDLTWSSPSPSPEPQVKSQPQPRRQSAQQQSSQRLPYQRQPQSHQPQPRRQSLQQQPLQQQPLQQQPLQQQPLQQQPQPYQQRPQPHQQRHQPHQQRPQQHPQQQPPQQSHHQQSYQQQPLQQQQRPASIQGEHRASSNKAASNTFASNKLASNKPTSNSTAAGPSRRTSSAVASAPKINEVYLRQLIETAPVNELNDLLLDLCKKSPALSGALVRGLAPHSIWAQNTIRDYQRRNVRTQVQPRHAGSSSAFLPPASSGVLNYDQFSNSRPTTFVKRDLDPSGTDSDNSVNDLKFLINPWTPHTKTPGRSCPDPLGSTERTVAGSSSSNYHATPSQIPQADHAPPNGGKSLHSARVKPEPRHTLPYCIQCEGRVIPNSSCHFHLGRKKVEKKGTQKVNIWTCCKNTLDSVGCCEADHMFAKDPMSSSPDSPPPTVTKKPKLV